MKISFKDDYSQGCHPKILDRLLETNGVIQSGYGLDNYSEEAREAIKKEFNCPEAQVFLVSGGTQANLISISAILRPHQSVIATQDGHIATNEAGAIEATGHKVNTIASHDGKLTPSLCEAVLSKLSNTPHVVQPKLVYISNTTELGTHYTFEELEALYAYTRQKQMYLFIDGARLAQALAIENTKVTPSDIARLCDAFYFGATKNGGLLGEAIVITNKVLQEDFAFYIKQKGAMLAKGRLLGIQFSVLLKQQLYLELATHANQQAMKLKQAFHAKGITFLTDSYSNQIFPILPKEWVQELEKNFAFRIWKVLDTEHLVIRWITAWDTPNAAIEAGVEKIHALK